MTDTQNAEVVPVALTVADLPPVETMTDREVLVEILMHMRNVASTVEELSDSPMVKALQGGGNPLMAMFGR